MLPPRTCGRAGLRARTLAIPVLAAALLVSFVTVEGAQASSDTITVSGRVIDATGGVVPAAVVDAVVAGRRIASTMTTEDGRYALPVPRNVPYELRARRAGFAGFVADMPGAADPLSRDIVLQVGGVSDTVVVTASGGAERRAQVTASVTVMTAADIAAIGASSVADVLRFVPGLSLEGNGREGSLGGLYARGGNSDYNLVLIDGVRVNQNGGVYYDLSRLPAASVERLEIVRGAQSALWGSDAIGSVVQIVTKGGGATAAPQVSGSVEGGTFATRRGETRLTGGVQGRLDYHAGVSHRGTGGAFADLLPENDWFEGTTLDGGIGAALGARASVRSGLRLGHAQGRVVGPVRYGSRNTGASYDTRDLTWHLSSTHAIGRRFTGTALVSYYQYRSMSADRAGDPDYMTFAVLEGTPGARFPDGVRLVRTVDAAEFEALMQAGAMPAPGQFLASASTSDFAPYEVVTEFRRPAVRYQGDYAWAPGQRLSIGYEWERESNPLVAAERLDNQAVFVQQQFAVADRWFATVGGRADYREGYASAFSPKLSAGGFVLPARPGALSSVRVSGNIGRGIKAPTFAQRLGAPWADPNPDLKVERARTADLGVEATFADQHLRAGATWFDNAYRDQIDYRFGPAGDGVPEYININASRADGWELEAALQRPVAGVTATGSYAFVRSEVVSHQNLGPQYRAGEPLIRRPRHSGALRVAWAEGRVGVHGDVRFAGVRHDNGFLFLVTVPNAERPSVFTDITVNPGYAVMGLGASVRVHDALTLFVRGDNLGNATYEHALGYPGLPRSGMVGLRFSLGGS